MCVYVCILYICMYIYTYTATQETCKRQRAARNTDKVQHAACNMQHRQHATYTYMCIQHATCNTRKMQRQCNVHNRLQRRQTCDGPHGPRESDSMQLAPCSGNVKPCKQAAAMQHASQTTWNGRHCNVQRCNMLSQRATCSIATSNSATAACDSQYLRPRSHAVETLAPPKLQKPGTRAPLIVQPCQRCKKPCQCQQAAHRKQAASPDIECGRRRVRDAACHCCCCWAVVSWQRSVRASL